MQMYNNLDNSNLWKIKKSIFENPTKRFHVRELARITKLNPNTITNLSEKLGKQEIIIKEKKKHLSEIYANIKSKKFITAKRIFNLSQLYSSGLVDFLEREYLPRVISVVGSYSRGEDIEKSDIDIVLIGSKEKISEFERFEKILSRKIHLISTGYKQMTHEFYTNLINGTILAGYLEEKS